MLEKQIQNQIIEFLRTIGIYCWQCDSQGTFDPVKKTYRKFAKHKVRGVSDILGIVQGRMLAIEVKSAKGIVSDDQRLFIRRIQEEGGIAFVSRSVEQTAEQLLSFFPTNQKLKMFCKEYVNSKGADH